MSPDIDVVIQATLLLIVISYIVIRAAMHVGRTK